MYPVTYAESGEDFEGKFKLACSYLYYNVVAPVAVAVEFSVAHIASKATAGTANNIPNDKCAFLR